MGTSVILVLDIIDTHLTTCLNYEYIFLTIYKSFRIVILLTFQSLIKIRLFYLFVRLLLPCFMTTSRANFITKRLLTVRLSIKSAITNHITKLWSRNLPETKQSNINIHRTMKYSSVLIVVKCLRKMKLINFWRLVGQ